MGVLLLRLIQSSKASQGDAGFFAFYEPHHLGCVNVDEGGNPKYSWSASNEDRLGALSARRQRH